MIGPRGGVYDIVNGKKRYRKYKDLPKNVFCGKAGGMENPDSFPVNSQQRCRMALVYSRFAPNPCGVVQCALKKAQKKGWKCGTHSNKEKKCSKK